MRNNVALERSECWSLLQSANVGRLATTNHALPFVLPVQYYLEPDTIAICLGHFEIAEHAAKDSIVAFSVDQIDPETRTGWHVQVVGPVHLDKTVGTATDCGDPTHGLIVHLDPVMIDGRILDLCPLQARLDKTESRGVVGFEV